MIGGIDGIVGALMILAALAVIVGEWLRYTGKDK